MGAVCGKRYLGIVYINQLHALVSRQVELIVLQICVVKFVPVGTTFATLGGLEYIIFCRLKLGGKLWKSQKKNI